MESKPTSAIAILIDNSEMSIDGDFHPTRLDAQKTAALQISNFTLQTNQDSQIAIFTSGSKEFGVRISFTPTPKLTAVLEQIKCGGFLKLEVCIKQAILSFHFAEDAQNKIILCFVGSKNDITKENADIIAENCLREGIFICFVVIGNNVPNANILEYLAKRTRERPLFIHVKPNDVISDALLESELGPGKENSRVDVNVIAKLEPNIAAQIKDIQGNMNEKETTPKKKARKSKKPRKPKNQ